MVHTLTHIHLWDPLEIKVDHSDLSRTGSHCLTTLFLHTRTHAHTRTHTRTHTHAQAHTQPSHTHTVHPFTSCSSMGPEQWLWDPAQDAEAAPEKSPSSRAFVSAKLAPGRSGSSSRL